MRRSARSELPAGLKDEDLPAWMRKPRHAVDWTLIAVALLCALVAAPFMIRPGLPPVLGYEQAAARTVEMSASLESGTVYPRWAPDFNLGYGSPLWNVLPPLPHYLAGLYRVAIQASAENSVKVVTALSVFLAGIGMLSFARRRWGPSAGLIAAAVYLFSPQLMVNKLYRNGDLAGLLAMGLLPVALAAVDRAVMSRRGRDVAVTVIVVVALWLADSPLNALMMGLILGWLAWLWVTGEGRRDRTGWTLAAAAVLLGTLAAAIYWLPALAERNTVVWHRVASSFEAPRLLAWIGVLLPPERLDRSAINPPASASLGLAVWLLPALVWAYLLIESWRRTPGDRRAVARGDALQWRVSQWFWRTLTPERRAALYFPVAGTALLLIVLIPSPVRDAAGSAGSDVLALVTACGALAAGQAGDLWGERRRAVSSLKDVMILAAVALVALPTFTIPSWSYERAVDDPQDVIFTEVRGYLIGSLRDGWLLPASIPTLPHESAVLINSYEAGQVDKVARDLLLPGTQVDTIEHTSRQERLAVDAGLAVTVTLLTFDYPGWRAQVDGRDVPVTTTPEGFISVKVPPGRHEVKVYFGSTPARRGGWLITLLALGSTAALALRLERPATGGVLARAPANRKDTWRAAAVSCAAVLLFGGAYGVAAAIPEVGTVRSAAGTAGAAGHPLFLALQGGIDLIAYDMSPGEAVAPGSIVHVVLYWRATRPDMPNYQVNLMVVGADDPARQIAAAQHRHPGGIPVSRWAHWPLRASYVRDEYNLALDDPALAGAYRVLVQVGQCDGDSLMPCAAIDPLFVRGSSDTSLGQYIALPEALVVR